MHVGERANTRIRESGGTLLYGRSKRIIQRRARSPPLACWFLDGTGPFSGRWREHLPHSARRESRDIVRVGPYGPSHNSGGPGGPRHTKFFYVKSAQICLRQPSRLNVILFAFPDHSRTEKVSDVSC